MTSYDFILIGLCVCGMYAAAVYGSKTKRFKWKEYFFLLAAPVLCSLSLSFVYGIKILYFFLVSAVVGFVLEYLLGYLYYKTLNTRLWTYGKYSVGKFTSLLTFPMWGVAGVIFWSLGQHLGL